MFVKNDNGDAAKEPNIVLSPQPDGMENMRVGEARRGSPNRLSREIRRTLPTC